jgi:hypothetical protein
LLFGTFGFGNPFGSSHLYSRGADADAISWTTTAAAAIPRSVRSQRRARVIGRSP